MRSVRLDALAANATVLAHCTIYATCKLANVYVVKMAYTDVSVISASRVCVRVDTRAHCTQASLVSPIVDRVSVTDMPTYAIRKQARALSAVT
jgi:hypothetical protein